MQKKTPTSSKIVKIGIIVAIVLIPVLFYFLFFSPSINPQNILKQVREVYEDQSITMIDKKKIKSGYILTLQKGDTTFYAKTYDNTPNGVPFPRGVVIESNLLYQLYLKYETKIQTLAKSYQIDIVFEKPTAIEDTFRNSLVTIKAKESEIYKVHNFIMAVASIDEIKEVYQTKQKADNKDKYNLISDTGTISIYGEDGKRKHLYAFYEEWKGNGTTKAY